MRVESKVFKRISDYIRYLSLMAVERAKSGHPGLPLGCSEIGTLLYSKHIRGYGKQADWIARDRFILSAGHGSMLVYALNYIFDYKLTIKDISEFRRYGSLCPGHPEYDIDLGIETTTGPLGQGVANSVGVALSQKMLHERYHTENIELFDGYCYCLAGDGCMMEGISYEAASMAGHLGLDNLIWIYDANEITIDGQTHITFTENIRKRFESQNWHVSECSSSDIVELDHSIENIKKLKGQPKLVIVKTVIGQGIKDKVGTSAIHGAPAGISEILYFIEHSSIRDIFAEKLEEEIQEQLDTGHFISKEFLEKEGLGQILDRRKSQYKNWLSLLEKYKSDEKEKFNQLQDMLSKEVSSSLREKLLNYYSKAKSGRDLLHDVLQLVAGDMKNIVGGSADLISSTKATIKGEKYIEKGKYQFRNIAYGVREHSMGAIGNGLALDKIWRSYTSTFLSFFDYMKPAVRLSALMELPHLFVYTHDSIMVGEDGPTHQPLEHMISLRSIPNLNVFRIANDMEAGFSFLYYLETLEPTAVIGSRQLLDSVAFISTQIDKGREELYEEFKSKGAYTALESVDPDIQIFSTGSELALSILVAQKLRDKGVSVKVTSIVNMRHFRSISSEMFLKEGINILMELSTFAPYDAFFKDNLYVLQVDHYAKSAEASILKEKLNISVDEYVKKIENWVKIK